MVYTADLIYIRHAYALALTRAAKHHIASIRSSGADSDARESSAKAAAEFFLHASIRLFRLSRFYNAVFQGLGDSLRIFELNHKTAQHLDLFFRINMASALILRTFSKTVNPDKYIFLSSCCKVTLENIAKIRPFFAAVPGQAADSMNAFLEVAELFYRGMMLHIAMRINIYEDKGLIKRTKEYKVNFVENNTLARELQKVIGQLEKLSLEGKDAFNVGANRIFGVNFLRSVSTQDIER